MRSVRRDTSYRNSLQTYLLLSILVRVGLASFLKQSLKILVAAAEHQSITHLDLFGHGGRDCEATLSLQREHCDLGLA